MKRSHLILMLGTVAFLNACNAGKQVTKSSDSATIATAYFGEKPPGLTPKLFDPAIVSPEGFFEGGSFTPDMKEFYFTRNNGKYKRRAFFVIRYENNRWGHESETDIRWPEFSEDGKIMYIGKEYMERTDTGWSELKSPGEFLKDMAHGRSVSSNGTYYFTVYKKEDKGKGSMYYSRLIDGKHENPVKMGREINTGNDIAHPYIAPDESYLIWDVVREDGHGQADLYISFKQKDGSWLPAINMGSIINTELQESAPHVTHDGKYLFFTRGEWKVKEDGNTNYVGKKYWVDTQVIENLRPKSFVQEKNENNSSSSLLEGPYLGQKPPGLTPEVFAPGIISTKGWEMSGVFTPDMKEFYFIREVDIETKPRQEFVVFKSQNNRWIETIISPRVGEPFISPDGKTLHLGRKYMERIGDGWSELKSLGGHFEEEPLKDVYIMRLTSSAKGTYVFDEAVEHGNSVLRYSRLINGKREKPKPLSKEINTGQHNAHPFIAPDESYIIWDGQRNSPVRNADLFISFKQGDGSWGEAIKMGDKINTEVSEFGARVTPDGKYLFFNRSVNSPDNTDIFWVDAKVIEDLRSKQ
ncbi:PD40 domain-containing protein [Roseivirga sp. E12]|uniref:PD40 domain-containing protein n=1 Tax=Roseivirga sp. E12 TaxID=2819237 RepID=UPI001ABC3D72|nr:PD40 domain-containing protein [Roseivirga sp. E12]MBO3697257.1 PD40 domain-containing protein [Roseivirga sp. E12]